MASAAQLYDLRFLPCPASKFWHHCQGLGRDCRHRRTGQTYLGWLLDEHLGCGSWPCWTTRILRSFLDKTAGYHRLIYCCRNCIRKLPLWFLVFYANFNCRSKSDAAFCQPSAQSTCCGAQPPSRVCHSKLRTVPQSASLLLWKTFWNLHKQTFWKVSLVLFYLIWRTRGLAMRSPVWCLLIPECQSSCLTRMFYPSVSCSWLKMLLGFIYFHQLCFRQLHWLDSWCWTYFSTWRVYHSASQTYQQFL